MNADGQIPVNCLEGQKESRKQEKKKRLYELLGKKQRKLWGR